MMTVIILFFYITLSIYLKTKSVFLVLQNLKVSKLIAVVMLGFLIYAICTEKFLLFITY